MKKSPKVQVNVPLDPEAALSLLIWAAYQGQTRTQFVRDVLEGVACAIEDIEAGIGVGTIEIQAVRGIEE